MKFSRRNFRGSTSILFGSMLMFTAPLGRWTGTPALLAVTTAMADEPSRVTFVDIAKEAGLNALYSSRGCAFGDFDNDGDIDVLVLNMNDYPSLLRNDGGNKNNWIKIKFLGTKCNRTAIGARVRVVAEKHAQMDEVHSGTGVMSQSDLRLHFGLGQVKQIDLIEVKWPTTQKIEKITDIEANQF